MADLPAGSHSGLGPDVVLDVWRRRKWVGIIAFCAVCAGAVTVVASLPNLYHATATVLVERQQISEAFVRPSVTTELETRIQTIHQQVMSRARLTELITRLNPYPDLKSVVPMDALVERMQREIQLTLKGVDQTTGHAATIAFTLSYTGRDARKVAEVTNALAAFYVDENTKSRERQATDTAQFLTAQLSSVKRELDERDRSVSEFKLGHAGELQQVEVNLTALDRLNTQLRLNGEAQIRALDRRDRLDQQLAEPATAPAAAAPQLETPATKLATLKQQLAGLRTQFSDRYPEVVRVTAEVAALEKAVAQRGTNGDAVAPAHDDPATRLARQSLGAIDRELTALKADEGSLRTAISGYEARVENAPRRQQELQQLSREYDAVNERYQSLVKRAEEARLAQSLERDQTTEHFRILDPAIPPAHPAAPNRLSLLVMALAASIAVGAAAIVAAEKFDASFHTADELQAFVNLPMLASVRLIPTEARARSQRRQVALITLAVIVGLMMIVGGSYYTAAGNEQIVRLTTRPGA